MRYGYTIVYVADVAATLTFYEQAVKAQSAKRRAENRRAGTALPA